MRFWDRKEKPYLLVVFLLPFVWMLGSLLSGQYFPDPGKLLMRLSGIWACVFMAAALSVSPLMKVKHLKVLARYRRFVGLSAFFYALVHLLIYLVLFAGLSWNWIRSDLVEKPYIYAGVLALVILFALAISSTKKMMKRLGRHWKRLHRLVYLAAIAIVAHLWWQVKSDTSLAVIFSVVFALLLGYRLLGGQKRSNAF
ncbi:Sulfoxide reductase heme-binding subunit YedZ [Marinomonas aquimarina]|uniref:Protein-methionine-sulfoxide reductase heme-binding subunit MsrQ n=1 Tax=Marinomonas aquimarina TaxID=295068 RepID=A0A1A8TC72_9GAMM|nr:protein-methionine-sulfoxide reductase heme-binding subunit MsrQ [Marinomonas aquimarina]SBS30617.1 Sulfoxide reductase heme-binding subunit YedZ [Marinomonas aquimarina]